MHAKPPNVASSESPLSDKLTEKPGKFMKASCCSQCFFLPLPLARQSLQEAFLLISSNPHAVPGHAPTLESPSLTCHQLAQWSPAPGCPGVYARAAGCPCLWKVVASLANPGEPLIFRETSAIASGKKDIHFLLQRCQVCILFYPFLLQNIYYPSPPSQRCLVLSFPIFFFFFLATIWKQTEDE